MHNGVFVTNNEVFVSNMMSVFRTENGWTERYFYSCSIWGFSCWRWCSTSDIITSANLTVSFIFIYTEFVLQYMHKFWAMILCSLSSLFHGRMSAYIALQTQSSYYMPSHFLLPFLRNMKFDQFNCFSYHFRHCETIVWQTGSLISFWCWNNTILL